MDYIRPEDMGSTLRTPRSSVILRIPGSRPCGPRVRVTVRRLLAGLKQWQDELLTEEEEDRLEEPINAVHDLAVFRFQVVELGAAADEEQVSDIFVRINSQAVKLNQANFILKLMSVHAEKERKELEASVVGHRPRHQGIQPEESIHRPEPGPIARCRGSGGISARAASACLEHPSREGFETVARLSFWSWRKPSRWCWTSPTGTSSQMSKPSPPHSSTGCSTTPTLSSPPAIRSGSLRPPPERGSDHSTRRHGGEKHLRHRGEHRGRQRGNQWPPTGENHDRHRGTTRWPLTSVTTMRSVGLRRAGFRWGGRDARWPRDSADSDWEEVPLGRGRYFPLSCGPSVPMVPR
jgi:hypothetical protein